MKGAAGKYEYDFPRPAVAVDCAVFGLDPAGLHVMLIKRGVEPYINKWALPGGFLRMQESLEEAALRELREETGLTDLYLEQLYSFGAPERDPRGRTISIAYYGLVNLQGRPVEAATDAASAAWWAVDDLPPLAFDHAHILGVALARLRAKVRYEPVGFELLPEKFTLTELQRMYEQILSMPIDKRNFRKKILGMGLLRALDEVQMDVAHRAARLYRFDRRKYAQLKKRGFNFEL